MSIKKAKKEDAYFLMGKNIKPAATEKSFVDYTQENLYIRSKDKSLILLGLNAEQQYIAKVIEEQKQEKNQVRLLILKSRQVGVSSLCLARLHYGLHQDYGLRGFVLAHRQTATNNLFEIMHRFGMNDKWCNQMVSNKNKSLGYSKIDSSCVFATAGSKEVARSDTIQMFLGSEVAYWDNEDNHLASVMMAVPNGGGTEIILESTSNGPRGMFYELCQEALKGTSEFRLVFLPWHMHEEYHITENISLPKAWEEYARQYNLNQGQITWAYLQNKKIAKSDNLEDGPSHRFLREFPASVAESFKFSQRNIFIPQDTIMKRLKEKTQQQKSQEDIVLGVDVARGGKDCTWIIDRQGNALGFNVNEKINTNNTMEIVGILANYIARYNPKEVCIDAGGGGIGVYDRLKELGFGNKLVLVHFAGQAQDSQKYFNRRAEMWGRLQDFLNQEDCHLINDQLLVQQIGAVEYYYTSKGQIQLEEKAELKKRIKQSPDGADAAALTFANLIVHRGRRVNTEITYWQNEYGEDYSPFS
jgi:hypothetical protein